MIDPETRQEGYVLVDALVALALSGIVLVATQISVATLADLHRRLDRTAQDRSAIVRARLALEGAVGRAGVGRRSPDGSILVTEDSLDLGRTKITNSGLVRLYRETSANGAYRLMADFAEDTTRSRILLDGVVDLQLQTFSARSGLGANRSSPALPLPDVVVLHAKPRDLPRHTLVVPLQSFDDPRCTSAPFEQRCLQQ